MSSRNWQQNHHFQRVRSRHLRLTTLALCMLPSLSFALGLGEIRSDSHLGEPLKAEINLVNLPPHLDTDSIRVRQVRKEEAEAMGVDIIANWQQVNFRFNPRHSQYQIQLSSRSPVREPYLNLLVEVVWPKGKLYREYMLILDPPAIAQSKKNTRNTTALANQNQTLVTGSPSAKISSSQVDVETLYTVTAGDTLSDIARQVSSITGDTNSDWESWIFQHNSHAFLRNSRHRLLAGTQLRIPQQVSAPSSEQNSDHRQHPIDALALENRELRNRLEQLRNSVYLLELQARVEQQAQDIKALHHQLANHDREPAHNPEGLATAPSSALMASTPFSNTTKPRHVLLSEKFWALTFSGCALAILLAYSLSSRFRSRKPALTSYVPPSRLAHHDQRYGAPIAFQRNADEDDAEPEQQPISQTLDDIDEMLIDLQLEKAVKERLQEELAPSHNQLSESEKEERDLKVQDQIKEKVNKYNREDHSKNERGIELEEIPIDPEMEAYLKL